ncbi:MAG: cytochrome c oxidase subunit II [Alphaproteobacteria bacterium]|nr:cytochrome c oxidase subunit II [Alphaproteobacteria bacterium]
MLNRIATAAALFGGVLATAFGAQAAQPQPWQMGFQPAASPVMHDINSFHNLLLVLITVISLFVLGLLIYVMVRFRASANPVPSRTTHNTLLEVLWTAIPIVILIVIAVPSFKLLNKQMRPPQIELTIKAIGYQWYWGYEYVDHGGFTFDAVMVADADRKPGQPRLLATDNEVVLPVDTNIRVIVTANDVLHAWTIPAFGAKVDAVPGRLNDLWFRIEKPGTYYGQCSELCGVLHGFMPIQVRAVTKPEFEAWVADAKKKFAARDQAPVALAALPTETR